MRLLFEIRERFAPDWRDDGDVVTAAHSPRCERDSVRSAYGATGAADDVTVEASGCNAAVAQCRAGVVRDRKQFEQPGSDPGGTAGVTNDGNSDGFRHNSGDCDTSGRKSCRSGFGS